MWPCSFALEPKVCPRLIHDARRNVTLRSLRNRHGRDFPDGKISAEFEIIDGLWNGSNIMYYANGKIRKQAMEDYDQTEGPYKYFHSNGQVELDYNFLHDNLHGNSKVYNEKGILTLECYYYNGLAHGVCKTYDDTGKLRDTRIYYYGDLIEIKK